MVNGTKHSKCDTGVTTGGFNQYRILSDFSLIHGSVQHPQHCAVLDAATDVIFFQLYINIGILYMVQRGVSNQLYCFLHLSCPPFTVDILYELDDYNIVHGAGRFRI